MKRLAIGCCALLASCAVGPNFHRPVPPKETAYRPGGDSAGLVLDPASPIAEQWWRAFTCPELDALVARGLANSPQVEEQQHRLRSAQAMLRAGYGSFFPQASAGFDAERQKYSPSRLGGGGPGSVFSLFTPSVAVGYVLDLFGGNRRMVEGLAAQATAQREVLRATRLTLAGTIATTAIARAAFHGQVEAWAITVAATETQLAAAHSRTRAGTTPLAAELALSQQLEAARSELHTAQARAAQADDQLAVLIGDPPASAKLPDIPLSALHLPAALPLRLPSSLVRERPDILVAEAQAHAASAQVGVATAAMLPQVTLSAGMGSNANSIGALFGSGTGVWNYAAGVAQPLFEGGTLINRRKAAGADYRAAMSAYRQTVLAAFGQVADTLSATAADQASDEAQGRAERDAATTYQLARANARAGLISDADLDGSQVAWQQVRITALAARAAHLQDAVALYVALGGGNPKAGETPEPGKAPPPGS